jgi:tricorn protease-like protein
MNISDDCKPFDVIPRNWLQILSLESNKIILIEMNIGSIGGITTRYVYTSAENAFTTQMKSKNQKKKNEKAKD